MQQVNPLACPHLILNKFVKGKLGIVVGSKKRTDGFFIHVLLRALLLGKLRSSAHHASGRVNGVATKEAILLSNENLMPRRGNLPGSHHAREASTNNEDFDFFGKVDVGIAQSNSLGLNVISLGSTGTSSRNHTSSSARQGNKRTAIQSAVIHSKASLYDGRNGPDQRVTDAYTSVGQFKASPAPSPQSIRQANEPA